MKLSSELLAKYDVPVPRYTSYPTVPYWQNNLTTDNWIEHVNQTIKPENSTWSMYLHIPFCESLCTFCGCNTIITKNHELEHPYLQNLLTEWDLYQDLVPDLTNRPLKNLHLGGGTPSFLSADHLDDLLTKIFDKLKIKTSDFEASIEVDPRRTNVDQLKVLRKHGFNRISMGVQDFNPEVQRLINRLQSFEMTKSLIDQSRMLGYKSVNIDLIYGLAKQTPESILATAKQTMTLRPDRIALYSFALVPWIKPAQRLFKDEDLPVGSEKRALYEIARQVFLDSGYIEIGMDHFALPNEDLSIAAKTATLHRNFMGYTNQKTDLLLGIGVSSISQTPQSFHQNEKLLPKYEQLLAKKVIPSLRGHNMTTLDQRRQKQILDLMTKYETTFESDSQRLAAKVELADLLSDGLIKITDDKLLIQETGKPFLRNACVFFDERLKDKNPNQNTFSKSL